MNGLMYTVSLRNVTVQNLPQNLFEIYSAPGTPILIHSIRIELAAVILSGIAQDVRWNYSIESLSTAGTGGTTVRPSAEHPRNVTPAATTFSSLITTSGISSAIRSASLPSVIFPFDRLFTPDQRIPMSGGQRIGLNLAAGIVGGPYQMSASIYFEEF